MTGAKTELEALIGLLEGAGYAMTECPVLVPAETVLDLVGPLTRGRLYLTTGIGGREFCLRPEFTIAIAENHIRTGEAARPAKYGYCGPVFRKRPTGTGEFLQAGAESIGEADAAAADAAMVVLAFRACRLFGVVPATVFGDEALFRAVLAGLAVPPIWQRRLHAAFGDRARLEATLDELAGASETAGTGRAGLAGFARLDAETATALVAEMIGPTESGGVARRPADEIAARLLEKARLGDPAGASADHVATIRAFLAIDCPLAEAEKSLAGFAQQHGIHFAAELDAFRRRAALIQAETGSLSEMRFQAGFGRQLDYYTGFIFDIFDNAHSHAGPVCGGGRYDGLAERLGAAAPFAAVGFSLWLDRLTAGAAP